MADLSATKIAGILSGNVQRVENVKRVDVAKQAQHMENVEKLEKLVPREVTRAIRDAICAEEGAMNQYETIVDSTDNELVKKVLQSIADEEKVHVGELQQLLKKLLKDEEGFLDKGAKEVNEKGKE